MNRCLRYILRIWWPNIISNKDLWKVTGQEDINLEIRKRKFRWIGHTLRKEDAEVPKAALLWNPQGNRKRGRPKNSWRRSVIKEAGRSWNELRFLAADRSGKDSETTYVPRRNDGLYYYYYFILGELTSVPFGNKAGLGGGGSPPFTGNPIVDDLENGRVKFISL